MIKGPIEYPQDVSPLPWRTEERLGHSGDYKPRPVIIDANGNRVAIISVRGSPNGDYELALRNAERLCIGANKYWENEG